MTIGIGDRAQPPSISVNGHTWQATKRNAVRSIDADRALPSVLRERHPEAPRALTAVEPSPNSALPRKLTPFYVYERHGPSNPKEFDRLHPAEEICGSAARKARRRRISPPAPYIVREHQHPRAYGQPAGVERSVGETRRQGIRVPSVVLRSVWNLSGC